MNKNTGDGELDEILFSQEYPIKNEHLKDCAFVWQDEGVCNCKQNIPKAKAAIKKWAAQEANKAQQQLLQELMEELPEKRHIPLRQAEEGLVVHDFNTAIDQVETVIQNKLEGLS